MGRGYDHIYGNPHETNGFDQGYKDPIFDLPYCDDLTSDKRYHIPQNVETYNIKNCHWDVSTTVTESMKDYSDSLRNHIHMKAGVSADLGPSFPAQGSFQASRGYQSVQSSIVSKSDSETVMESYAECSEYQANLKPFLSGFPKPLFTREFKTGVEEWLPNSTDQMIETFGTYYTKKVSMGIRYGQQVTISKNVSKTLHETGTSLNDSIESLLKGKINAIGIGVSGGFSKLTEEEQKRNDLVSKYILKSSIFMTGSSITGIHQWSKEGIKNALPINQQMEPIYTLLTPENFPDDPDIEAKRLALSESITNYCKRLEIKNCYPEIEFYKGKQVCAKLYPELEKGGVPNIVTVDSANTYVQNPKKNYTYYIESLEVFDDCELEIYRRKNFVTHLKKITVVMLSDWLKSHFCAIFG